MDLIQRHEQSFYSFVHKVHSKGEGLFDSLMHWIELFLTVVRDGLGEPISLEFLLPHTGSDRTNILAEVDEVAKYHYKLKVLYEDKIRRRFGRAHSNEADAEDEATQALVNGVVGEISFGDLVHGDALDLAAEETDEESTSDDYSSSEYETGSDDDSDDTESSGEHMKRNTTAPTSVARGSARVDHRQNPHQTNVHRHNQHYSQPSTLHAASVQTPTPTPQPKRKRSFSLKRTKSMNFSMSNLSLSSKRNQEVPPVPPLPAISHSAYPAPSRPLPPSPGSSDGSDRPPPVPKKDNVSQTTLPIRQNPQSPRPAYPPYISTPTILKPQTIKLSKKQIQPTIQPPELEHIPKLLPVFVEMVSYLTMGC